MLSNASVATAVVELAVVELAAVELAAETTVSVAGTVSVIVAFAAVTVLGAGCRTSGRSHAMRATTRSVSGRIFTLHRRSATRRGHEFSRLESTSGESRLN